MTREQRIEDLIADICRRAGGIYGDPTPAEFAQMLVRHGLEVRVAPEPRNPLDGERLWA